MYAPQIERNWRVVASGGYFCCDPGTGAFVRASISRPRASALTTSRARALPSIPRTAMIELPTLTCPYCRRYVRPIQGTALYRCPACNAIILPSQVASALDDAELHQEDTETTETTESLEHSQG